MQKVLKESNTEFKRITGKPFTITLSEHNTLTIFPLETMIKQKEIEYPAIKVSGHLGISPFEVYSYKYKKETANAH